MQDLFDILVTYKEDIRNLLGGSNTLRKEKEIIRYSSKKWIMVTQVTIKELMNDEFGKFESPCEKSPLFSLLYILASFLQIG